MIKVIIISETSKTNFRKSNKADIDAYCYLTDTLSIVQELTSVIPFLWLKADISEKIQGTIIKK